MILDEVSLSRFAGCCLTDEGTYTIILSIHVGILIILQSCVKHDQDIFAKYLL
jgi:hypothetical protein